MDFVQIEEMKELVLGRGFVVCNVLGSEDEPALFPSL
jgi:hypothetical protein